MDYYKVDIDTASPKHPEASVLIIYTGGTLGMVYDETANHLVPFNFGQILDKVPELMQFNYLLTVLSLKEPIDSSNISLQHWIEMASVIEEHYYQYDGFVILHGTDTMAYSASALSYLLKNLGKPVIFTGAQVPIGKVRTDARENLITALEIAATKSVHGCLVPEVCIFFNNVLLRGNRSKKVETSHFHAFKSENYPPLAQAGTEIVYNSNYILPCPEHPFSIYTHLDDRVAILKLFPGISEKIVRNILFTDGLKGVVMETYGSGNAPTESWFLNCLEEAMEKDICILNVSQCDEGKVDQGRYETSAYLRNLGIVGGYDITTEAAISKLMFVLGLNRPIEETKLLLSKSLRGEMTI